MIQVKKNKKRVFIVHGFASWPEDCWFPWLRRELENRGFSVFLPEMPEPRNPDIERWVAVVSRIVKEPDADTFFVGHSLGVYIILKYIQTLAPDKKVGGVVAVGGALRKEGKVSLDEKKIKKVVLRITKKKCERRWGAPAKNKCRDKNSQQEKSSLKIYTVCHWLHSNMRPWEIKDVEQYGE